MAIYIAIMKRFVKQSLLSLAFVLENMLPG